MKAGGCKFVLFLREVADHVTATRIALGHDVEKERLDIVVKGLMVEEELRKQAEVLAVDLLLLTVYFEHRESLITINLVARRVAQVTLQLTNTLACPDRENK